MNPANVKMVSEGPDAFEMHDGKSPFRVAKRGLSPSLEAVIRSMSVVDEPTPAPDAGQVTFGQAVQVAPQLSVPPPVSSTPLGMSPEEKPYIPPEPARRDPDPLMTTILASGDKERANKGAAADLGIRPKGTPSNGPPTDTIGPVQTSTQPVARAAGAAPMPGMSDIRGGIETQKGAAVQGANIEAEKARQTGEALGAYETQLQANALEDKQRQEHAQARTAETMAAFKSASDEMRNINTTVDPGRFWASRSTPGKIVGIIGMALGSLRTGPDGSNAAVSMIERAIDRDVEAQKSEHALKLQKGRQSVDAAQSAYAMNHQIFQDELATSNATKASLFGLAENSLKKITAGSMGPAAQAQAAALAGALQEKQGQLTNAAANTAFDNTTQRILANAQAGKARAGAGLDPKSKDLLMEVESRNASIQQNGNKLLGLIDAYGTAEKLAPGVEVQMRQLATDMAVDAAKLKDPSSVVRPSEMQTEIDNIFAPGFMQRRSSAKAAIKAMMDNSAARRKVSYEARGK